MQNVGGDKKQVNFKDMKFHRCVKLNKFSKERAITFIPPDGEFDLMDYIISDNIQIPFKLICFFSTNKNKLEYKVKLSANFNKQFSSSNLIVKIPVPENVIKAKMSAGSGKAKHDKNSNVIIWKFKKF